MASVTLKNIYKVYPGGVTAVNNFNLDITDKEFVILVGPSGCGKSTTLRMIAGLEEITDGELYIGDRLMNDVAPKDRDIAMVFQNYALYPHMTVYENMAFGLKLRKTPKAEVERRVEEAAKILDIEHLLNRKPKALSGGQRQRVALGRAIVREPKVFLMDEPLSNLDAKLRVAMRTEITKLHRRLQTTFIYVTHDQTEALTMGTRIVVMKDGFIMQVDTPMNLYNTPDNVFVAGFIGSPQMNFFDAKLRRGSDGKVYCLFGEERVEVPEERIKLLRDDSYIGGADIIMGLRPEDIHDDVDFLDAHPQTTINAKVDVVEMMGAETYLYLALAGRDDSNVIARVSSRSTSSAGDAIKVAFDGMRMHFFDKETEKSLLKANEWE
nr:sn-glycerol-3-phosphate ABC transporter ATP-binding protein UgpC [bacterium]